MKYLFSDLFYGSEKHGLEKNLCTHITHICRLTYASVCENVYVVVSVKTSGTVLYTPNIFKVSRDCEASIKTRLEDYLRK